MSALDQRVPDTAMQPKKPRRIGSFAAAAIVIVVLALVAGFMAQAGVFAKSGISALATMPASWEFDTTSAHFEICAWLTTLVTGKPATQSADTSLYGSTM